MDYGVPFHEEESEPEEDGAWPDDGSVEPIDDTPPLLQAALVGDLLTVRRELTSRVRYPSSERRHDPA